MKNVVSLHKRPDIGTVIYQILMILLITGSSTLIFSVIGLFLAALVAGVDISVFGNTDYANAPHSLIEGLKVMQLVSVIGIFIVPLLIIPPLVFRTPAIQFLSLHRYAPLILFALVGSCYFLLTPLMELTITLNQKMNLPEGFDFIEKWMRQSEQANEVLTKRFLQMPTFTEFLINTFLIAILPAIAEELFFRGLVQRSIYHWTRNIHVAIIIAAVIFSAIHMQFFGFLPRMLLGLFFGYLLYWSGDIKLPIFAHFLNNFSAVLATYLSQHGYIDIEVDKAHDYHVVIYFVSAIIGGFFLYFIYKTAKKKKAKAETDQVHYTFPQRPGKWQKVFSSADAHEVEIICGFLKNEGIESVIINKKESSYNLFGQAELYVHDEDVERAQDLMKNQ